MTHNVKALDPRRHDYLAAAAPLGAEQQNLRNPLLSARRCSEIDATCAARPRLNIRSGAIQPANRIEHFEIRGRTPTDRNARTRSRRDAIAALASPACRRSRRMPNRSGAREAPPNIARRSPAEKSSTRRASTARRQSPPSASSSRRSGSAHRERAPHRRADFFGGYSPHAFAPDWAFTKIAGMARESRR